MCVFCEEPSKNIQFNRQNSDSNIVECFMHKSADGAALFLRQDLVTKIGVSKLDVKQNNEYVYVKINYCPFCEKKL